MTALPNALAPSSSPLRTVSADHETGSTGEEQTHNGTGLTFSETIDEQSGPEHPATDRPLPESGVLPIQPDLQDIEPVDDTQTGVAAGTKPDITPIAEKNGNEDVPPETVRPAETARVNAEDVTPPPVTADTPRIFDGPSSAQTQTAREAVNAMAADVRLQPGSQEASWRPVAQNSTPTPSAEPMTTHPVVAAAGATTTANPTVETPIETRPASANNDIATDPRIVTHADGRTVEARPNQTSALSPVTLGTAPADRGQTDVVMQPIAKADTTPIADVTGDIEAPRHTKVTPALTEPTRPNIETLRASDLPTISTLPTASAETLATPKTLPLTPQALTPQVMTPQVPMLTAMSGLGERMVANYMQAMPNAVPVTVDKLPQTVVALTLNARSATLQIDPPELGRIQLEYQFDTQGRTVVTLVPESEAARAALLDRMAAISTALSQSGSGNIDVRMGDASDFASMAGGDATADGQSDPDGRSQTDDANSQSLTAGAGSTSLQYFTRGSSGQTDRLHILV